MGYGPLLAGQPRFRMFAQSRRSINCVIGEGLICAASPYRQSSGRNCLGLCDACPYAPACALILPSRAGVAQAPMEETAAYFAAVAKAMGI